MKIGATFPSGAVLERKAIAKHPEAWYYVEKWPSLWGDAGEREASTWIPDEVADRIIGPSTEARHE